VMQYFSRSVITTAQFSSSKLLKAQAGSIFIKRRNHIKPEEAREIRIPTPNGHIAGKEWGNLSGHPILCYHGGMDNCNTFQPLAPYLSTNHHYVALDVVGHGRSSHSPLGTVFNFYQVVVDVRRVMEHFKFSKISILGHSMGANIGLLYGSIYPQGIERLILLDLIKPIVLPLPWHTQVTAEAIEMFLRLEKKKQKGKQKSYQMEELVSRYVNANQGTISNESAKILMERGSEVVENGYGYSYDPQMNSSSVVRFSLEDHRAIIKNNINCHLKIIKAKQGPYYEPAEILEEFKTYYKQQCKSFEYVEVEGQHHVHMDHPERIASHINDFFHPLTSIVEGNAN